MGEERDYARATRFGESAYRRNNWRKRGIVVEKEAMVDSKMSKERKYDAAWKKNKHGVCVHVGIDGVVMSLVLTGGWWRLHIDDESQWDVDFGYWHLSDAQIVASSKAQFDDYGFDNLVCKERFDPNKSRQAMRFTRTGNPHIENGE